MVSPGNMSNYGWTCSINKVRDVSLGHIVGITELRTLEPPWGQHLAIGCEWQVMGHDVIGPISSCMKHIAFTSGAVQRVQQATEDNRGQRDVCKRGTSEAVG